MRCALIVLGWTLGLPLAVGLGFAFIAGVMALCIWIAEHLGLPQAAGGVAFGVLVFGGMGAVMGVAHCREGR